MNMKKIFKRILYALLLFTLTACFLYDQRIYDNPYDPDRTSGARDLEFRSMVIDGNTADWTDIQPLVVDQTGEAVQSGATMLNETDLYILKMTQDQQNLYFYIEVLAADPLSLTGLNLSVDVVDENWENHTGLFSMHHDSIDGVSSQGTISTFSAFDNPSIRFAGPDSLSNAVEGAISKHDYWETFGINQKWRVLAYTRYDLYGINFGDNEVDNFYNGNDETFIILKAPDELTPELDTPLIQFDYPSSSLAIDGSNSDLGIWSESGYWYKDFSGDDMESGEANTDIDEIYMKQDEENVYMLMTFNDPGGFNLGTAVSYHINIDRHNGVFQHSFEVLSDGASWTSVGVNYLSGINTTNCLAASGNGYLELQFDKSEAWNDLPFGPFEFHIESRNSTGTPADRVKFKGSYKGQNDPVPSP